MPVPRPIDGRQIAGPSTKKTMRTTKRKSTPPRPAARLPVGARRDDLGDIRPLSIFEVSESIRPGAAPRPGASARTSSRSI